MKRLLLFALLLLPAAVWSQKRAVILTAGQSNADGRVAMDEFPTYITAESYQWCRWSYGSGDFMKATGEFTPFWPTVARKALNDRWGFDAIVYALLNERLQQPFYVIKHTMGGTAIDTSCVRSTHRLYWSADSAFLQHTRSASRGGRSLLKAFTEQIDLCIDGTLSQLEEGYDIKALLWHQGESDMTAAERYGDNLKAVIDYIRQHLAEKTGEKKYLQLPVICGTFAANSRQGSPDVAEAMRRLAREDKVGEASKLCSNVFVVEATDLSLQSDQLHFDAKGAETLGKRYYEVLEKVAFPIVGDAFKGVWPVTDKKMLRSLNGTWDLKVVKGIDRRREVPRKDETWGQIPVPGCWEAYGFCQPKYDYPDSLTGYYRTTFSIPKEWKGQQVVVRLDGVLRGYDLWLNDQLVGTWESAYNTCLFDLTPYLTAKAFRGEPQQLAMRVYSQFKGYEFDCFDDWAAMGIFRDVTLMAVPQTHLSDLIVTTKMNGEVTVKTKVANATSKTTVDYEILDDEGRIVSTNGHVPTPRLWTAETPYLYTLRVHVKEKGKTLQTFTQKIGIREISIDGNVLKLNGQPIKLRGVNAHATDSRTVKVIGDTLTLKDMLMMKEASVNYMRLSHYPREPRFYELADSLGFYLVDEVPFGYGDKHLGSRSYQGILLTRAEATVNRDKNHPSVLVWSVGNENPLPQTCVEVGNHVGQLDPSRPYCFPQVGSYFRKFFEGEHAKGFPSKAPVYAPHYPTTGQMGGFYQRLDRPVIFTEYCHTLGISFEDHDRQWEIIERSPGIAGGSVWEWADQGMPFEKDANGQTHYGYEEKVYTSADRGFEMFGNKGTDGLVYADRTPLPNYYELQHNYAQAFVQSPTFDQQSSTFSFQCVNRYDFLNLKDNVIFHWTLTNDRDTVMSGAFSPDCAPHSSVPYCLQLPKQSGLALLHFEICCVKPQSLEASPTMKLQSLEASPTLCNENVQGYTILHQSFVLNKPTDLFDASHFKLHPSLPIQKGPLVRVGRKATMAERLKVKDARIEKYLQPLDNPYVKAEVQTSQEGVATKVSYSLTPDTTDTFLSELGVAFLLDAAIDRVQWIGQGPFASYPGRHQANRYGFWAKHMDDLYFEGNRMGIDAALFSDKDGNGILITAPHPSSDGAEEDALEVKEGGLNLNFEQTDRGVVMTVNAAVSGQGPKFSRTAFPIVSKEVGTVTGAFHLYRVTADTWPRLFKSPQAASPTDGRCSADAPFHPFETQYDTYLLRFSDIYEDIMRKTE